MPVVFGPKLAARLATSVTPEFSLLGHGEPGGAWARDTYAKLLKTGRVFRYYSGPELFLVTGPNDYVLCKPRAAIAQFALMFNLDLGARATVLIRAALETGGALESVRDAGQRGDALVLDLMEPPTPGVT